MVSTHGLQEAKRKSEQSCRYPALLPGPVGGSYIGTTSTMGEHAVICATNHAARHRNCLAMFPLFYVPMTCEFLNEPMGDRGAS